MRVCCVCICVTKGIIILNQGALKECTAYTCSLCPGLLDQLKRTTPRKIRTREKYVA